MARSPLGKTYPGQILGYRRDGRPIYAIAGGADGTTNAADLIVPEVWGDQVQAKFLGNTVFAGLSVTDNRLEGVPGDTAHFPKWTRLGDAAEVDETDSLVPEKMGTDDDTAKIKEVGKAVEITDKAILTGLGDPMGEARRQLGVLIARKVDTDLKVAGETSSHVVDHSGDGPLSWDYFVDAIELLGDAWDSADMAGVVIHSKQHATLLRDKNFISADKYPAGSPIARGEVGTIGGVRVFVSDRITQGTAGSDDTTTYKAQLVRRNALGLLYKRRPQVENDRDILNRSNVITTNVHYATKLLDDKGIVVLQTQ
jgi:N4-gp56 family major capsid protein